MLDWAYLNFTFSTHFGKKPILVTFFNVDLRSSGLFTSPTFLVRTWIGIGTFFLVYGNWEGDISEPKIPCKPRSDIYYKIDDHNPAGVILNLMIGPLKSFLLCTRVGNGLVH